MTTIRVKKDARYFSASNEPFNDKRLSWEARGLMGYLLSKPNDWEVRSADLEKQGPAKSRKVKRMLAELRLYGYMNRIRTKLPNGKFEWTTEVYESPSQNPRPTKGIIKTSVTKRTSAISTTAKKHHILSTEELSTELNGVPPILSIENQIAVGAEQVVIPDNTSAQMADTANLIATGFGVHSRVAYEIALAFMRSRGIVIATGKVKGQRKAIREMIESGVSPQHVSEAVQKLTAARMTVTDLYSVSKTAIDLAHQPDPEPLRML
jgi:hypothetical protein